MVFRRYVEKKPGFASEAATLMSEARDYLGVYSLESVRVFNRYDIEGVSGEFIPLIERTILSEPQVDDVYAEALPPRTAGSIVIAVEPLPGQYDQRADSCAQCIEVITKADRPTVRCAKIYSFSGNITEADADALRKHLINKVESREASMDKPESLAAEYPNPPVTPVLTGFINASDTQLYEYLGNYSLAMDIADLKFMQNYFAGTEKRDPTLTELRLIDTYWSDHCRHTTFLTSLDSVKISDSETSAAYSRYLDLRNEVYGENAAKRPVTLMDIATIGAKALKKRGLLKNLDVSDEINACSIVIDVETGGKTEPWLLMFKNETHNHPTEIEPFGGAATCIGGAIRDPLSGRAYVYQAMRVTGAADPRLPLSETIPGKLPQRRLTTTAAAGYSSYGNQIGLATGLVHELYHPNYAAKRMEVGAVVGAVKADNVRRETPAPGDVVLLLGGRTGRDGIGGATGSSKSHTEASIETMSSEVQKGNAPEERKIQRLFRDNEVTLMIKRCNDFGAGGVSVAVGELADGLDIDLTAVRKKYEGLTATEIAISESQERMAVVVSANDADKFIAKAAGENLEAYIVAKITDTNRMVMRYGDAVVADISRDFLSSNGAEKHTSARVESKELSAQTGGTYETLENIVKNLKFCSQRGLGEMFDSSVGAGTVLSPYGGKTQRTASQVMSALIPVQDGETSTASVMSFGFDPYLSEIDPYGGAKFAVVSSIAKLVAAGVSPDAVYLSFQEYFEKLGSDPLKWGLPLSALLGALDAQIELETAAIGGKDSMSGTFLDMNVPPTLISFAIAPADARHIISSEFKTADHDIALLPPGKTLRETKEIWRRVHGLIKDGKIISARAVTEGGVYEAVIQMSLGNNIGAKIIKDFWRDHYRLAGGIIAEIAGDIEDAEIIGRTTSAPVIEVPGIDGGTRSREIKDLLEISEKTLDSVFPKSAAHTGVAQAFNYDKRSVIVSSEKFASPRATVLSFPGTNSEIDTQKALLSAGADADILVIRNLTPEMLRESVADTVKALKNSQILVLPGGFSGGDEPDGSAKFIAAFLRSKEIVDAAHEMLYNHDGLMLGICNGFQALIKLGLVPYGKITEITETSPTLTHNIIGRHVARYVNTRIASVQSPWMSKLNVGEVYAVPISHGEGRFIAGEDEILALAAAGQIATQYCNSEGNVSALYEVNPNGSLYAVEGIFSPDGRVFGKMGHTERAGKYVGKNISGEKHMPLFESGVYYFK